MTKQNDYQQVTSAKIITSTPDRETWQGSRSYEAIRLFDWFWRVELDGRLVATVVEMQGQWRGWVGADCLIVTSPPKVPVEARRAVVKRVIETLERG